MPVQRATRPAGEFGQLLRRGGRRPLVVVGPAQAQDAGHGDDEGIVGLGIDDGNRHVDVEGEAVLSRFVRLQDHPFGSQAGQAGAGPASGGRSGWRSGGR